MGYRILFRAAHERAWQRFVVRRIQPASRSADKPRIWQ